MIKTSQFNPRPFSDKSDDGTNMSVPGENMSSLPKDKPVFSPIESPLDIKRKKLKKQKTLVRKKFEDNSKNLIRKMQSDISSLISVIELKNNTFKNLISLSGSNNFDLNTLIKNLNSNVLKSDGAWGRKTKSALSNVYGLAAALLNANTYYKLNSTGYDLSDFSKLRALLNGYKLGTNGLNSEDIRTQGERASVISTHIMAIINYLNDIDSKVMADDRISDDEVVEHYDNKGGLSLEDIKLTEDPRRQLMVQYDINGESKKAAIPYSALVSKNSFEQWFNARTDLVPVFHSSSDFFNKVVKPLAKNKGV